MKLRPLLSTLLALSLATSGLAFAEDRNDHGRNEGGQRGEAQRPDNHRSDGESRGAGPQHAFHKGGRLPPEYRQQRYVVDDWRGHHLSAPPRGYHWVQTGGDYVLVAIATGVILNLLLAH